MKISIAETDFCQSLFYELSVMLKSVHWLQKNKNILETVLEIYYMHNIQSIIFFNLDLNSQFCKNIDYQNFHFA